jgi:hypothetical protein
MKIIFIVIACICFFVKGAGINTGQVDMMNVGFGSLTLSLLV